MFRRTNRLPFISCPTVWIRQESGRALLGALDMSSRPQPRDPLFPSLDFSFLPLRRNHQTLMGRRRPGGKSHRHDLMMKREMMRVRDSLRPSPSAIDAPLPYRREGEEEHVAGSASENTDVSFLKESLETTTLEGARRTVKVPPPSRRCLPSSRGPPILAVRHWDWGIVFYIRIDRGGSFHTYPHVGGPFKSLQEARNAIDRYLHDRQDRKLFMPGLSNVEMGVRCSLYWPDGTRKMPSKSHPMDIIRNWTHQLAQALVDEYNEEHSLVEDLAYQVKEVLHSQSICEGDIFNWYHHINFTTKVKGVDHGITNLFFAEVICKKGKLEELVPSCLRMLEPSDNGTCHGCQNNGSGEHMKHPNDASAYTGGHVRDAFLPFGGPKLPPMAYPVGDEDELHRAEEARLRAKFTALKDARAFDKYKGPPPGRKPVTEAMRQQWVAIGGS